MLFGLLFENFFFTISGSHLSCYWRSFRMTLLSVKKNSCDWPKPLFSGLYLREQMDNKNIYIWVNPGCYPFVWKWPMCARIGQDVEVGSDSHAVQYMGRTQAKEPGLHWPRRKCYMIVRRMSSGFGLLPDKKMDRIIDQMTIYQNINN